MNNENPTKKFLTRYYHDGAWWATSIQAYDWKDAEIRARKLNMQLDGEAIATIPAFPGTWLPNLIVWILTKIKS